MINYKIIDHTADIAVEFYGKSIEDLFESAASSLSQIVYQQNKPETTQEIQSLAFQFDNNDPAINFIDYLREILFLINQEHYYFTDCNITDFGNNILNITCDYIKINAIMIVNEIKAVTYHDCSITQKVIEGKELYVAKVTFDI